jgi:hypothetical protein
VKTATGSRNVKIGLHKKATYTFPPDVIEAIDQRWRFHKMLNATLADSKSAYVADLIRRDASRKVKPKAGTI